MDNDFKLPDKLTFKRLEVIRLTRLDGKVIDFWEKEFGAWTPMVNKLGEKFYTRQDVALILKIKQWLIVEKREKAEIKRILRRGFGDTAREEDFDFPTDKIDRKQYETLKIIKSKLQEMLTIIDKNDKL